MAFKSLLSFVFLGLTVVQASTVVQIRDSPISIAIATRLNTTGGAAAILKADRARLAAFRARDAYQAKGASSVEARASIPIVATEAVVSYVCEVGVGSPPTQYSLIVDTGSSNTWVGAAKAYTATSTSSKTSNNVFMGYGSGQFSGTEYTDTITIGSAVIKAQSIGVASSSSGFSSVDGILGIGPTDLTAGSLSPASNETIPTVTDNMKSQGIVSVAAVGVSFEPSEEPDQTNGQLDFGGVDHSRYTGTINYVPVTTSPNASYYWGITQSITYGTSTTIISPSASSAGIVDTGITLLYLPTEAFQSYQSATKGTLDQTTGLLQISDADYANLKSLFFTIGAVQYEFTANAQIWPRSLNPLIGGTVDGIYLIIADSGVNVGSGLDFTNGFVWLQRFYAVFDSDQARIGFANTQYTVSGTN